MRAFSGRGKLAMVLFFAGWLAGCGGEAPAPEGEQAVAAATPAAPAPTLDEAGCDVERAPKVFEQCKVCHSAEKDAPNLTGPNLHGVVGRKAASVEGFAYSKVIRESGIVWTTETLEAFLANPLQYLPNNRMAFGGVTNAEDRQAVVCLLTTLG